MKKKVMIKDKPEPEKTAEAWIANRKIKDGSDSMKRLTIDIPEDLHKRIKIYCAENGLKISDVVRSILNEKF